MLIDSITIPQDYWTIFHNKFSLVKRRKKDIKIDLKAINIIVGENGCGKSTFLDSLRRNKLPYKLSEGCTGCDTHFFEPEFMNPRLGSDETVFSAQYGEQLKTSAGMRLHTKVNLSHGQTIKLMVIDPLETAKDCLIFLDEPESGLDLKNQKLLKETIHKAIERNCQFIINTHSYYLINSVDTVYDFMNQKWTDSKKYLKKYE